MCKCYIITARKCEFCGVILSWIYKHNSNQTGARGTKSLFDLPNYAVIKW